jgi:hypothetical protein
MNEMFVGYGSAHILIAPSRKMGHTPSHPNQKRRAVLRGSLAAPVVLTVSSPAAAVSSLRKCLNNQNARNAEPFISASADTWLRKPVDVHKLEKSEGKDKDKDKDKDNKGWAQGGGPDKKTTDWVYFDEGLRDYVTVAAPHRRQDIGPLMNGWKKVATEKRWGLVWVDENSGTPYSRLQIQRPTGYTACTNSCYTSFNSGSGAG